MAYYGLSNPFIAKLDVAKGTYSEGFQCGEAVGSEVNPNYIEGSLHGDNKLVEHVKVFKDADVTLTVTTLPLKAAEIMFGHEISEENNSETDSVDDEANYVGYGFIAQEIKNGVVTYPAAWLPKVKFSEPSDSFTTNGDSITFGTPQVSGKAASDASTNWRYKQTFATHEEAVTWLKGKANIT
jgi:phi13 family phage major tail protein